MAIASNTNNYANNCCCDWRERQQFLKEMGIVVVGIAPSATSYHVQR